MTYLGLSEVAAQWHYISARGLPPPIGQSGSSGEAARSDRLAAGPRRRDRGRVDYDAVGQSASRCVKDASARSMAPSTISRRVGMASTNTGRVVDSDTPPTASHW